MTCVNPFDELHPQVAQWCHSALKTPTLPQAGAIVHGMARQNHLIVSPTGTGKTLAAFLPAISRLAYLRDDDKLFPRTYIIYISPLRALGYDVEYNVRRPLREMQLLERPNSPRPELRGGRLREQVLRTAVRTGDTPTDERRLMLARPPHILLTTPESLALMAAMPSYRKTFTHLETIIIDEVHALAGNKRGAQLALVLEQLAELCQPRDLLRIGLSATVAPLDRVAHYLVGNDRPCEIVDARALRATEISVEAVSTGPVASLTQIAHRAADLTRDGGTTLVFTNVRSQAERLAHEMEEQLIATDGEPHNDDEPSLTFAEELKPKENRNRRIGVHHSALERSVRHQLEARLRKGELRTVVCSASLELGVDIGYIDQVFIVGGARGISSTLQRVGRSGHRPDAIARGRILAQDRDDLLEGAATIHAIRQMQIDEVTLPDAPLDVLAQWIVASVVPDRRRTIDELLQQARRAASFTHITESDVRACVAYLSGGGVGDNPAHVRRVGFEDGVVYGLGRDASSAFYENVGTIPDEHGILVRTRGAKIGRLEESFVAGLHVGDSFLMGGRTMRVVEVRENDIEVEPHVGRPSVPVWSSHLKGLPEKLARAIGTLRRDILDRLDDGTAASWLQSEYRVAEHEAEIMAYYIMQQARLSLVPDGERCVIEVYMMDGRQGAVFHTCTGRRINEVLARIVGARVHEHIGGDARLTTDDMGFMVMLDPGKILADDAWASMLTASGAEDGLRIGLRASSMLGRYFRYNAHTAILVLRRAEGRRIRRRSHWNSSAIFDRIEAADPEFPLVRETYRTICHDILDSDGAFRYLADAAEPVVLHPKAATPFTFGILSSSFGDAVHLADREAIIEALHARVMQYVAAQHTS
jgi:ATP-dependent Lhr-like helicase